jgi:glycerophosphoryl diester phosphodiesterase
MQKALIVGHRGAMGHEPENTLLSFKAAIEMGADWIELDLRCSKDGEIVVIHDRKVDRVTDGKGSVSQLTLKELKRLDAGKGQKIPTLQEVIDFGKGKVKFDMEVKQRGIEKKVIDIIKKNGILKDTMLTSFNKQTLFNAKRLCPEIKAGYITSRSILKAYRWIFGLRRLKRDLKNIKYFDTLILNKDIVTKESVTFFKKIGFQVAVWNVDDIDGIKRYLAMKPDYICTNYPDRAMDAIYSKS